MARIRTIKPEMFQSRSIKPISFPARWTFAGLLTHVDDGGGARDDIDLIRAAIYPLELETVSTEDVEGHLAELAALDSRGESLVCRYEVNGERYLHVVMFLRHQKINRPSARRVPPCPKRHTHEIETEAHAPVTGDSVSPHRQYTEPSGTDQDQGPVTREVETYRPPYPPPAGHTRHGSGSPDRQGPPDNLDDRRPVRDTDPPRAASLAAEAIALLNGLEPAYLRPARAGADDVVAAVAELLALGWPAEILTNRMTADPMPADRLRNPAKYLVARLPEPTRYRTSGRGGTPVPPPPPPRREPGRPSPPTWHEARLAMRAQHTVQGAA